MSYADLLLIGLGFGFSFIIGLCAGGLAVWSRVKPQAAFHLIDKVITIAEHKQEIDGWEQWYSVHMRQCALLEQSNRAGLVALAELESAR